MTSTAQEGRGREVAVLVSAEGIEQVELTGPWQALVDAGWQPVLVAPEAGRVQAVNHLDPADTFPVDRTVADVGADDFAGVVIPGGVANPDLLRLDERAVALVRDAVTPDRPVAAICHGIWMLVEADVLSGRCVTSWPSLRTDVRNAGGEWVDEEVVVDGKLITSRKPDDVPAFNKALLDALDS